MKSLEVLLRTFVELHPEDAARAFENLEAGERIRLFKTLPPRVASAILHQFDDETRERFLSELPDDVSRALRELARYPDNTAGGIMEPRVASIPSDLTAQQATAAIRKAPREALHYLYVTRRDGTLQGVLNMRDFLLAAPRDPIESHVRRDVFSVSDTMDSGEVVQLMREKKLLALPVVDFDGRLVGVVKHAQALQAGHETAFEDLQKMVGAGANERALSPVTIVIQSRLPWLYVNLVTAFMAAAISGAIIPLILQALGRDPAQSSAILLTTVTDIVGFASFQGFATAFMPMMT